MSVHAPEYTYVFSSGKAFRKHNATCVLRKPTAEVSRESLRMDYCVYRIIQNWWITFYNKLHAIHGNNYYSLSPHHINLVSLSCREFEILCELWIRAFSKLPRFCLHVMFRYSFLKWFCNENRKVWVWKFLPVIRDTLRSCTIGLVHIYYD